MNHEWVNLKRDVQAVTIPMGNTVLLKEGSSVMLHQALGGDYTLMTDQGYLARIEGKDADSIGIYAEGGSPEVTGVDPNATLDPVRVWDTFKAIYDPEIPVNVLDLGLIYDWNAEPVEGGGQVIKVKMTMTNPGCGMGNILQNDVERKLRLVPGVRDVQVEIVFDPPWTMDKMSDAAKLKLGFL
ncbi:MAG TPA: putative Fe-S cluster assembly protein SufT [Anaerolineales bacterium]